MKLRIQKPAARRAFDWRRLRLGSRPGRLVVSSDDTSKLRIDVFLCECLCIPKQVLVNEVVGKVRNSIAAGTIADEAELFEVGAFGNRFVAETRDDRMEIAVKCYRELLAESSTVLDRVGGDVFIQAP